MTRGVCLYLVGSLVLVSLAGCGRGFFQFGEREPWRTEAEIACLKSGAVKESAEIVRVEPISGPGICGADYPLKVAALGEASGAYGFADESLRPPGDIGTQPRWPVSQPTYSQQPYRPPSIYSPPPYPPRGTYPESAPRQPGYGAASNGPISLAAPGIAQDSGAIDLPPDAMPPPQDRYGASYSPRPAAPAPLPPLGPARAASLAAVGPVAVKPAATLACPIVSVLDRWLADSVQPAAQRWFGARVVEIKQISAYSCRGMNGNPHAHVSEHAFGNALDIAAFTLADGRRITVKDGWRGVVEEQGFLRDVQAAACREFNTVLAPGSNVYHSDHIHVDLMRRASGQLICEPAAISGQEIAARASRNPYAFRRDPYVTGSLGARNDKGRLRKARERVHEEEEFEDD